MDITSPNVRCTLLLKFRRQRCHCVEHTASQPIEGTHDRPLRNLANSTKLAKTTSNIDMRQILQVTPLNFY